MKWKFIIYFFLLYPSINSFKSPQKTFIRINSILKSIFQYDQKKIRNFSIIAHIDHGKSTLADRLLEKTNTVDSRNMEEQILDSMDIERERGITIKLNTARMTYQAKNGETYLLNLIDTPGHVDFGYEVSRSLAACEGSLLVVDSTQGVEAQTMANTYLALENNLEIIPILNKIDLSTSDIQKVKLEIESLIGIDCSNAISCSAKTGEGVDDILESIISKLPPPSGAESSPLRAMIFDSYFDIYRGVVVLFRIIDGEIKLGDKIRFMNSQMDYEVTELGVLTPSPVKVSILRAGEVGFLSAGIRCVDHARVGDTICLTNFPDVHPLPGYTPAKQMVFAGLYPTDSNDYLSLRDSMEKLRLNDASFSFAPEASAAMGSGFRCGFLGLLHMDIVRERLEREYDLDLIITAPSVVYKVVKVGGEEVFVQSPAHLPDPAQIQEIQEPFVKIEMIAPTEFTGPLMDLAQSRRGVFSELKYLTPSRSSVIYEMPLAEVITNLFDDLKSRTKGYGSMSFSEIGFRKEPLVKLEIRINGEEASPLSCIVHRDQAHSTGKHICHRLKELIPRQQFKVPIQAYVGCKVVASEHINPMMKDVLAKCYGGDITRKKKLLDKQAKGKKRMKLIGKVNVPQEAFLAVIQINDDNNN